MKTINEILKQAKIVPLLRLAVQKEGGGEVGTGPHRVKLLRDKAAKRINARTGKEEYIVWLYVEENGEEKKYPIPVKDKNGEVHYLIQRLGEFKEGDEIIMEYKRREGSVKGFIDVRPVTQQKKPDEEIPVIEEVPEIPEKDIPLPEEEDISAIKEKDIPVIEDENYEDNPKDTPKA